MHVGRKYRASLLREAFIFLLRACIETVASQRLRSYLKRGGIFFIHFSMEIPIFLLLLRLSSLFILSSRLVVNVLEPHSALAAGEG